MLRASLFGPRASETVDDWRAAVADLRDDELLWIDSGDPDEDEAAALAKTFDLPESWSLRPTADQGAARLVNDGARMHLTVYATRGSPEDPRLSELVCLAGPNWVVTLHAEDVETIDEFREHATGGARSARSTHRRSWRCSWSGSSRAMSERSSRSRPSSRSSTLTRWQPTR